MYDHNLVPINDTHQVLLGGGSTASDVYLFDWNSEEWTDLPSLNIERRYSQAGLVTYPNGTQAIVIAGGNATKSSEIWIIDSEEWIMGPDLPTAGAKLEFGASVSYGNTFLIVGGYITNVYEDTIVSFNILTEDWEILPQRMKNGRRDFAAFMIPNSFIKCTLASIN